MDSTLNDFWTMIRDSGANVIIMVTQTEENGRAKCHPYWPRTLTDIDATTAVQMIEEDEDAGGGIVERKLIIRDKRDGTDRTVHQIQFIDWPDHGVPDDPSHFLDFAIRVNELQTQSANLEKPVVLHCSAGVGRTGVTIMT